MNLKLDLLNVECPDFIILLRNFINQSQPGDHIMILANTHNAKRDVERLCVFGEHQLLGYRKQGDVHQFLVQRGTE